MEYTIIQAPQSLPDRVTAFSESLIDRFIQYTDVKEITLKGYGTGLKSFMNWLLSNGITQPARDDVKQYRDYLDNNQFTAGTRASYLRVVKHFFKWTASEGLYPNIADNIKGAKVSQDNTKKEAFDTDDFRAVLAGIERDTVTGKRDYAIILLSTVCALRIIELNRANIEDLQTVRGSCRLYIQGKGHDEKDDYVKIVPEVAAAIQDYLDTRPGAKRTDPLFVGTSNRAKGARLSEPSLSVVIKSRFKAAGFDCKKLTAHSLRHTGVTTLLRANGGNIQQAQRYARHKNLNTTLIYSHNIKKEDDTSESTVYDYIFRADQLSAVEKALMLVKGLSEDEAKRVINYINTLKGE